MLNENITGPQPGGAAVLENFFPADRRGRAGGSVRHATIGTNALAFDGQTANFTVGGCRRAKRPGQTGKIASQTDAGATGTLQPRCHRHLCRQRGADGLRAARPS